MNFDKYLQSFHSNTIIIEQLHHFIKFTCIPLHSVPCLYPQFVVTTDVSISRVLPFPKWKICFCTSFWPL